jgi:hypothetical protein
MHANIFSDIIEVVQLISKVGTSISYNYSSMNSYNASVVTPTNQLSLTKNWLQVASSSYNGWMSSVLNVKISSSNGGSASSFETALRSGLTGGSGSNISSRYVSVYGQRLSGTSVTTDVAKRVDAYDTTAQEGMITAARSDNASTQLISTANRLQSSATTTAPGVASTIAAEAEAMKLQSNAMQHHVLASMLRQEATRLADITANTKSQTSNHGITVQKLFGGGK